MSAGASFSFVSIRKAYGYWLRCRHSEYLYDHIIFLSLTCTLFHSFLILLYYSSLMHFLWEGSAILYVRNIIPCMKCLNPEQCLNRITFLWTTYLEDSMFVLWDSPDYPLWVKLLCFEGQPTDSEHKRKFQPGAKLNPGLLKKTLSPASSYMAMLYT